jgi:hypothetical protein
MLKSADALADAGHDVRVVATCHEPWAVDADMDVRSRRSWPLTVVDYRRGAGVTYWRSGIRYRASRMLSAAIGPERLPLALAARAFGRVHSELVKAASAEPADLIYGGTTGGLAAVAVAARWCGARYALDLEDFHSGESEAGDHALSHGLARRIEDRILGQAAFLTASSEGIAQAYHETYGVAPNVIHNTFDLPPRPPDFSRARPDVLRLYWFSQTIGAGRGLEDAVRAMGIADVPGILMKQGEQAHGTPLTGLAVKVMNGFFVIGFATDDTSAQHNEQLLKEFSWLDIPIVYTNGARAILAIEKGPAGDRAFAQALPRGKRDNRPSTSGVTEDDLWAVKTSRVKPARQDLAITLNDWLSLHDDRERLHVAAAVSGLR